MEIQLSIIRWPSDIGEGGPISNLITLHASNKTEGGYQANWQDAEELPMAREWAVQGNKLSRKLRNGVFSQDQ